MHRVGFTIEIYYDARPYEGQKFMYVFIYLRVCMHVCVFVCVCI